MYVCICNAVTDRDIQQAADAGASTLKDLRHELNVATCCGRCASCAKRVLKEARKANRLESAPGLILANAVAG